MKKASRPHADLLNLLMRDMDKAKQALKIKADKETITPESKAFMKRVEAVAADLVKSMKKHGFVLGNRYSDKTPTSVVMYSLNDKNDRCLHHQYWDLLHPHMAEYKNLCEKMDEGFDKLQREIILSDYDPTTIPSINAFSKSLQDMVANFGKKK